MSHRGQHAYVSFCFLNGISGTITVEKEVKRENAINEHRKQSERYLEEKYKRITNKIAFYDKRRKIADAIFDRMREEAEMMGFPLLNGLDAYPRFLYRLGLLYDPHQELDDFREADAIPEEVVTETSATSTMRPQDMTSTE